MTLTKEEIKSVLDQLKADEQKEADDKKAKEVQRKFTPGMGTAADEGVIKDEGDQRFASLGAQLMAVRNATMWGMGSSRIDKRLLRCVGDDYEWTVKDGKPYGKAVSKAPTGAGETVPSDGAFLVAQEFIPNLITRTYNTGIVFSRTLKQPVGANFNGFKIPAIDETSRADGSRFGGVQAYWGAEAASITSSKPKFRQISIELQKLFALAYVTDELLEDSVALEGYIMQWFPMEFGFKLDDAVVNGDGAGKPLGILNSPGRVTVSKETNQTATTIVTSNVLKMFRRMWAPSWPNSLWLINQNTMEQLMTLTIPIGTAGALANLYGGNAYQLPGMTGPGNAYATGNGAPYGTILGRPVLPIEQCATVGTEGDIILVDLSQYIVGQKGDLNTATSIHVAFVTDQTAFRFIMRINGEPIWHQPLTPYKGTSDTLSPYVTLATRS